MSIKFKVIISTLEDYYGIPKDSLLTETRVQTIAIPRLIAMYICRTLGGMTYVEIGDVFNRNHSTVIRGCLRVKKLMEHKKFLKQYNQILKEIYRAG